ncbi:hypothetical protein ACHHYP_16679 [Achlya hypogyna]|uniref:Tudor domain-containing protein n=1 Tax=Achlya hypogyna TaxID=1202772 RepID=A0A1V9Y660_ACHHY|nr:hypothetical protein ACHHYP_16679 [Achlya hypogyna]
MDPSRDVGSRVEVYWDSEEDWFHGTIQEYDPQVGYRVLYDDGDEQWEDSSNTERVHVLRPPATAPQVEAMEPPTEPDGDDAPSANVVGALDPPSDDSSDDEVDIHVSAAKLATLFHVEALTSAKTVNSSVNAEAAACASTSSPSPPDTTVDTGIPPLAAPEPTPRVADMMTARSTATDGSVDWTPAPIAPSIAVSARKPSAVVGDLLPTLRAAPPARRQPAGPGTAVLNGRIQYLRGELETGYSALVKVSFVAPGPGSVMLRCKTVLFSTAVAPHSARPEWPNAVWSYSIPNDNLRPWASLRGDILLGVFHQEAASVFVGQVLLPLESFLDDDCPGGPQTRFDEEYALTSRQGKVLDGLYLRLAHQLVLPPGVAPEPSDDGSVGAPLQCKPRAKPLTKKKHVASPAINRTKRAAEINRENARYKQRLAATKGCARPAAVPGVPGLRAHSSINRQRELAAIAAENRRLEARREPKKVAMVKAPGASSKEPPVNLASQATYVVQLELTTAVAALQHDIAGLHQEVFAAKASLSRYAISNAKDARAVQTLQKAYAQAHAASVKRDANHKPGPSKGPPSVDAPPEKAQHLALLEQENAAIVATRQELLRDVRRLHAQEAEVKDALAVLDADFTRVERRRAYLRNPAVSTDEDQRLLQQAWTDMTSLKVHVSALEERLGCQMAPAVGTSGEDWAAKLDARRRKEAALVETRDAFRAQYEALVQAKSVETLRASVLEMQHMLLLCEREEKLLAAAMTEADLLVQDAAMDFALHFRAEQTDTDILFKVTTL